jgi:hypothetical protein
MSEESDFNKSLHNRSTGLCGCVAGIFVGAFSRILFRSTQFRLRDNNERGERKSSRCGRNLYLNEKGGFDFRSIEEIIELINL